MVSGCEQANKVAVRGGAFDKIISDDIEFVIGFRMSADEAVHAPVINNVIDVLNGALGFGIAAFVINPKIVAEGDIGDGVHQSAESLGIDALAEDAVLESDIVAAVGQA